MTFHSRFPLFWSRPARLVVHGLLGSIGLWGNGLALAQTTTPAEVAVPESPVESARPSVDPIPPVPEAPETIVPPEAIAPPVPNPTAELPAIEFSNPSISEQLAQPQAPVQEPTWEEPSAIVFSERSTGCQSSVQYGSGVPGGICPPDAPTATSIPGTMPGAIVEAVNSSIGAALPPVSEIAPGETAPIGLSPIGRSPWESGSTASVRDYYSRTIRPPARIGNGNAKLLFPLSIPAPITSLFGWRIHPIYQTGRFHSGTDLGAPLGTPVVAAYTGRVAIADFMGGYGLTVTLQHTNGTQETLYAHLSEIFVKPGDLIKQGSVIGRVGSTGASTGPHLHFEFRQLTSEGWVALDAGTNLEMALTELVTALQTGKPTIATEVKPLAFNGFMGAGGSGLMEAIVAQSIAQVTQIPAIPWSDQMPTVLSVLPSPAESAVSQSPTKSPTNLAKDSRVPPKMPQ